MERLRMEFARLAADTAPGAPAGAALYDGKAAAAYAARWMQPPNPAYYDIGDWIGNCANFTSQCIRAGFGGGDSPQGGAAMTDEWFAGAGGGSPAWENVGKFWDYAMRAGDFGAMIVPTAAASITICLWLMRARCALHKIRPTALCITLISSIPVCGRCAPAGSPERSHVCGPRRMARPANSQGRAAQAARPWPQAAGTGSMPAPAVRFAHNQR